MLKRTYALLNLDTGEGLTLGRSLVCDPKAICADIQETEMMCISDLWCDGKVDDIKKDPSDVIKALQGLSTFLIASRGHRLVLIDLDVLWRVLDEVYLSIGFDPVTTSHVFFTRFHVEKDMCSFIQRRWKNLQGPATDLTQDEGYINKNILEDLRRLFERKIKEKGFRLISDHDKDDYKDIISLKF